MKKTSTTLIQKIIKAATPKKIYRTFKLTEGQLVARIQTIFDTEIAVSETGLEDEDYLSTLWMALRSAVSEALTVHAEYPLQFVATIVTSRLRDYTRKWCAKKTHPTQYQNASTFKPEWINHTGWAWRYIWIVDKREGGCWAQATTVTTKHPHLGWTN